MPRATRTKNTRVQTWVQVRKADGSLWITRDWLAGKGAVTRWTNKLERNGGKVVDQWTVGPGNPQPQWVTDEIARRNATKDGWSRA